MTMSEDKKNGKQNKTVKPFDPMTLRGVTVRNRIWLPPMDTYSALAQDASPRHSTTSITFRVRWAASA